LPFLRHPLLRRGSSAPARTHHRRRRSIVLGALSGCFAIAIHSFVDFNLQVTANAQLFLTLLALTTPIDDDRAPVALS
jgi:hypothetical protein